jgi:SAM-dependent methyltransferase
MDIMITVKDKSIFENIESWNSYSREYFDAVKFSDKLLHIGLGLTGIRPDKIYNGKGKLLDVGCGNGLNTFLLAKLSLDTVTGIDPAENAIREAKTKYQLPNLKFHVLCFDETVDSCIHGDTPFANMTFFGSLDYVELNDNFFYILNKITEIGSKCFIAKFHPFWTTLFDNDVEQEKRKSYYNAGRKDKVVYGRSKRMFTRFHYPLSYILRSFKKAGWHLDNFDEPEPDLSHSAFFYQGYDTDDIMKERLLSIPMTMILEFTRAVAWT